MNQGWSGDALRSRQSRRRLSFLNRAWKLLLDEGMRLLAAMLLAILGGAGIFCVAYQKQVANKLHARFEKKMAVQETPTPAARTKPPEMSLVQAVTIKTPDGALTIPKGARVRVIEQSNLGMVAVNYQGYTAPIPANALSQIPP